MRVERSWKLIRFAVTAVMMFLLWLLFTGSTELFSLVAGGAGSLLIAALVYDVFLPKHEANIHYFLPHPLYLIRFLFMVVFFLYQSSAHMLRAVVTGRASPRIVHFRTRLRSDMARMVLASAITFTPGTVTLDLNDDHLTVHWFFCTTSHAKAAGDAVKGRMEKYLGKVWS